MKQFTFVDICCGIGAFHVALGKLGGHCVLACDTDEQARLVYEANHGSTRWHTDIFSLTQLPAHDVFCAGFPCTTFSVAGLRRGTEDNGPGQIIFKLISLLSDSVARGMAPSVVILENVPGLVSIHNGETLDHIKYVLTQLGYNVDARVFDAADFGSPMHRERLIITGTRDYVMESSPKTKPRRAIQDFTHPETVTKDLILNESRYVMLPKSKWYVHDGKLFVGYLTAIQYHSDDLTKISSHSQALKIYHSHGLSENFTSTNKYTFLIGKVVRYLSPREMYDCMGFPSRFQLSDQRSIQLRQLTNSINLHMLTPVCAWIMKPFCNINIL